MIESAASSSGLHPSEPGYPQMVFLITLMSGIFLFILGITQVGYLANLISHPVISGFTSAAAFLIGFSQLKHLFGISMPRDSTIIPLVKHFVNNVEDTNGWCLLMGLIGTTIIILFKVSKKTKWIPVPLFLVVVSILLTKYLKLDEIAHIKIVGTIPKGFLPPINPLNNISESKLLKLIPVSIQISLVIVMESVSIGKTFAAKSGYTLQATMEFIALSLSNIVGSFFGSYACAGSFTRTAVNHNSGAKSPLSNLISGILVMFTILVLTPLFYFLPYTILAAFVLSAVYKLFDYQEIIFLWRVKKRDLIVWLSAFLGTLFLGIELGILISIAMSFFIVVVASSFPTISIIGKTDPEDNKFVKLDLVELAKSAHPNIMIILIEESISYANIHVFKEKCLRYLVKYKRSQRYKTMDSSNLILLIDATHINEVDSTGMHGLKELYGLCDELGVSMYMMNYNKDVRKSFEKSGLLKLHPSMLVERFEEVAELCGEILLGNIEERNINWKAYLL
eukprot:TRINITY_DN6324_c0_g1_i1.p1 TRINITY_DN6324_c0_g1~~TRINITY_DN6324_c0_g1_i1.p1  ORF type:complete len:508 (+),score=75.64 TRINITY_DN6324_c0_g1_i1:352-1875(+)